MSRSREQAEINIYVNGRVVNYLIPLTARESVGGANVDTATFEVRREKQYSEPVLQNVQLLGITENDFVEVERVDRGGKKQIVHAGRIVAPRYNLSEKGESIRVVSRFDKHMFGAPWVMQRTVPYPETQPVWIDEDAIFNPIVDDEVVPNMAANYFRFQFDFIEPDTLARETLHKPGSAKYTAAVGPARFPLVSISNNWWSLREAVWHCCWVLNPNQKYVKNPSASNLLDALGTDRDSLRDFKVPRGKYLNEILDALLIPYGFQWWIEKTKKGFRQIRVQQRGVLATKRTAKKIGLALQAKGRQVDDKQSEVKSLDVSIDMVNRSSNSILCVGDYEMAEATVILIPAWEDHNDDLRPDQLQLGSKELLEDPKLARVWRDWVLNENDDYSHYRDQQVLETVLEWEKEYTKRWDGAFPYEELFENKAWVRIDERDPKPKVLPMLRRRRKLYPAMTLGADGTPLGIHRGVFVEWSDQAGAEDSWRPIEELSPTTPSVQLLSTECGVRIQGNSAFMYALKGIGLKDLRIRVTASFKSDFRIKYSATHGNRWVRPDMDQSKLKDLNTVVVDLGSSYKFRRVVNTPAEYQSAFWDVAVGSGNTSVNDFHSMRILGNQMLTSWSLPSLNGSAVIQGVDNEKNFIGATVTGVDKGVPSRRLGFQVGKTRVRYPDVVGVDWDFQSQQTTLTLDTFQSRR